MSEENTLLQNLFPDGYPGELPELILIKILNANRRSMELRFFFQRVHLQDWLIQSGRFIERTGSTER